MRIKSVRIQNLRAFKDQTIDLEGYTAFVGANGSGKSTILCALNIFFRETAESPLNLHELQAEDFHDRDTSEPVRVTVTFADLSDEAKKDFANYFRQGELVVTAAARFDAPRNCAPVLQYGQRKVLAAFAPFFEADKQKAGIEQLRVVYSGLRAQFSDLPDETTKPKMTAGLREFEEAHPDLTELVQSPDEFYGFSKGENRLARHIQWVYVPAVKDVSEEQAEGKDTAIGKLLSRTVRARIKFDEELKRIREEARAQYDAMLQGQQAALKDLSDSLSKRLGEWTHPDAQLSVRWHQEPDKSVRIDEPMAQVSAGEGTFLGNLGRMGHGLQRAYLLALLQELSAVATEGEPTLVLAVEEPELYQHPPQCRHMSKILQDLTEGNSQVIVTTHSPVFVGSRMFRGVRMVRKRPGTSTAVVSRAPVEKITALLTAARGEPPIASPEGALAKIHQSLQPTINEIFFAPFLVLVEGREDIAYILTYMNLMGLADELRRVGCHVVEVDGKSALATPFAITKELGIPTFLVFDADTDVSDRNGNHVKHKKDNLTLLRLAGTTNPDPWPPESFWSSDVVMWHTNLGAEVEREFDGASLKRVKDEVELEFGQVGGLGKNPLFIAELLQTTWNQGMKSGSLKKLCKAICAFCGITGEAAVAEPPAAGGLREGA